MGLVLKGDCGYDGRDSASTAESNEREFCDVYGQSRWTQIKPAVRSLCELTQLSFSFILHTLCWPHWLCRSHPLPCLFQHQTGNQL